MEAFLFVLLLRYHAMYAVASPGGGEEKVASPLSFWAVFQFVQIR